MARTTGHDNTDRHRPLKIAYRKMQLHWNIVSMNIKMKPMRNTNYKIAVIFAYAKSRNIRNTSYSLFYISFRGIYQRVSAEVITTMRFFFFESPIFKLTESGMSELSALKQEELINRDFFPCPFRLCIENLEPCSTC